MNDYGYACVLVCMCVRVCVCVCMRVCVRACVRISTTADFHYQLANTVATRLTLPIHRGFCCGGVIGACTE